MSTAPVASPRPSTPLRRAAWWLLGGLLAAVVLATITAGSMLAWLRSESGTAWLVQQVPGLEASGVRGTPWDGELRIAQLRWSQSATGRQLQIDELTLRQARWVWRPNPRAVVGLDIEAVGAARVTLHAGAATTEPLRAPDHLRLPIEALIRQMNIGELQIAGAPAIRQLGARLHLGADGGARHRIESLSLQVDRMRVQAQAQIGADAPLPLDASLQLNSTVGPTWTATLEGRGPLARIDASATLRGNPGLAGAPARLDAKARIEPFAAWPLASLDLATQGLDLSALASHWPSTRIAARAQVMSSGLDKPAAVSLQIDNATPGRWQAGRLPLAAMTLDVGGTPKALDKLQIRRFDARLADDREAAGRISGQGQWVDETLQLSAEVTALQPARLDSRAAAISISGPVNLTVTGLPALQALRQGAAPAWWSKVNARIEATLTGQTQQRAARAVRVELRAQASRDRIAIEQASARDGAAQARFSLDAQRRTDGWSLAGSGEVARFDPLPWWRGDEGSRWRQGPHRLDGRFSVDAVLPAALPADRPGTAGQTDRLVHGLRGQARIELRDSVLAGVTFSADAALKADGTALDVDAKAQAGDNRVVLGGRWHADAARDRWQFDMNAPALSTLAPWSKLAAQTAAVWPTAGSLSAQLQLAGRWPAMSTEGTLRARGLRSASQTLGALDARWRAATAAGPAWDVQVDATDWRRDNQRIDAVQAQLTGTQEAHRITLRVDSPLRPPAWSETLLGSSAGGTRGQLQADGRWQADSAGGGLWTAQAAQLRLGARASDGAAEGSANGAANTRRAWLDARDLSARVRVGSKGELTEVALEPARALLPGGAALRWGALQWAGGAGSGRLDLMAELEPLAVAPLLAQLQPELGWTGDLRAGARIEVHAGDKFDADIVFERAGGDLGITDETGQAQALGLSDLRVSLAAHDGIWQFTQGIAGKTLGEMAGAQVMRTDARLRWPAADTPLEGVLQMRVANLGAWGAWVPPGWRLGGSLRVGAGLGGRFGAPELRGEMVGSALALRNVLQGVNWSDGELSASLAGTQVTVETFSFKGGDGTLRLTGGGTLGESPSARLTLKADRFRLLGRIDRRLIASGEAELLLRPDRLTLDGRLDIDEGLFDFSRADAPSLDSDVNVVARRNGAAASDDAAGTASERGSAARAPLPAALRNAQVGLRIGLGDKLALRGRGLDTLLRGDLRISSPGGRLAVSGTVRTQSGTYFAYGQKMEIERGEVVFAGAVDNPRLDIRAVRPNLDVVVGVAVTGTTANPRVRLFSEPEMSDIDKLSWLVLGRSPTGLGRTDTALLQRAAIALLSGEGEAPTDNLIQTLGLTEFSLRQSEGEVRETVVSLGRQVSRRWYVGYERSVNATTGTWQLIYRIAQRFTLRAQSGQENSLDVIWSWRW